ncbi:MAG TPA: DUF177 domain-containing protein [Oscillospiraceae bacterium]|nr:DUF177 domain-containing protein [Oscillospiraceae bacterium]
MLLNLKKVFSDDNELLSFEYQLDLTSTEINGFYPFVSPLAVKGTVKNHAGAAQLDADVSFDFSIPCDRCTAQVNTHFQYAFNHVLVLSLNDEENDSYIQVENYQLDLDELLRADVLLELPAKYLCKPDCKGLCPVCGKNLNTGSCNCNKHQVDPRLEALKQLID